MESQTKKKTMRTFVTPTKYVYKSIYFGYPILHLQNVLRDLKDLMDLPGLFLRGQPFWPQLEPNWSGLAALPGAVKHQFDSISAQFGSTYVNLVST